MISRTEIMLRKLIKAEKNILLNKLINLTIIIDFISYFTVLYHKTLLFLLLLIKAYLVDLPLYDVELFEMVIHPYPCLYSLFIVLYLFLIACVAVWEV